MELCTSNTCFCAWRGPLGPRTLKGYELSRLMKSRKGPAISIIVLFKVYCKVLICTFVTAELCQQSTKPCWRASILQQAQVNVISHQELYIPQGGHCLVDSISNTMCNITCTSTSQISVITNRVETSILAGALYLYEIGLEQLFDL